MILPECRTKVVRNVVMRGDVPWVPLYCANCGADGGIVPEENCDFAFYLCMPCSERWGNIAGTYMEPDHVFWEKIQNEQIEKYGRLLNPTEQTEILKDDTNILTRLAKERPDYKHSKMT